MAKVTNRMQAFRDSMSEALKPNLEPDEELLWFNLVKQLKAPSPVRFLLSWSIILPIGGPMLAMALEKNWYVGITPRRVLFGRMSMGLKPDPSGVVAIPLADVTAGRRARGGGDLFVAAPTHGLPPVFRLAQGIDIAELQALLQVKRG